MSDPRPRDWAALPWSRSARWFIPRLPPTLSKAGHSVYYPVTLRSRVGWELGRALADRGAFRFLPSFTLIPREVLEAAEPLVPDGGGFSVAKANHPGRFLTLIFDGQGRPTAFVKVARDTFGAAALSTERDALERVGSQMPSPLIVPKILHHADGVLVFESLEWQARARPWRLPQEVAFAMGVFHLRTRTSPTGLSGASHGDFAPWNLLWTSRGWGLVDWESFRPEAPPFYDVFHYLLQANSELRRPSVQAISDGLRGKGWVGRAVHAYAAGVEIVPKESRHFLREYLRISTERLGPEAPRRGERVRTRMMNKLD